MGLIEIHSLIGSSPHMTIRGLFRSQLTLGSHGIKTKNSYFFY